MRRPLLHRGALLLTGTALAIAVSTSAGAAGPATKDYAEPVGGDYETHRLLSVGQTLPRTSDAHQRYQMVGIPDGLGAQRTRRGVEAYLNHEMGQTTQSQPLPGRPPLRGAFVSKLAVDGWRISGDVAYHSVYQENTPVGPLPDTTNTTPAFSRFCSATLAGPAEGFDRPIFFTNEESSGASTFDGRGGQSVAILDDKAFALPKLGHFAKENTVPQRRRDASTVILSLEDGPSGPESQLFMYVGTKDRSAASPLARNGLDNGRLYVFVASDPTKHTEADFTQGSLAGSWVEIPSAAAMSDVELEAAVDAVGAFGFVRIEDGSFSKTDPNRFYFDTTGGSAPGGNVLGRVYQLELNPASPTNPAQVKLVYNADAIVTGGGDIAISPDNVDVSRDYLMVQEDGTAESRAVMAAKGRDGSIWRIPLRGGPNGTPDVIRAQRVVTLSPPGADGVPVGPGVWETSGIIDASILGRDTWLFDVQAHPPTTAPGAGTVEDGQLLVLRPRH